MRAVVLRCAAWVVPLLVWTSLAAAAPDPREMMAREAFAAGRYQDALDVFVKLYAEKLHPNYLRNIARCYQNLGEADRAISSFREYLRKAHKVKPAERAEVEGYIVEMEELKKTQASKEGAGAGAAASATGKTPAATAPPAAGAAPAAAATPAPQAVVVVEREVAPRSAASPALDLSARPAPEKAEEPSPVYTRWWFWAIVGGVVAAGVGGAAAAGLFTRKVDGPCDHGSTCQ
jgi:tetratricopeptide (TPR) repeat protein